MDEASILEWACIAVMGLFLIVTALCQIPWTVGRFLRNWDVFDVVPFWTFFAPEPGRIDLHLLYRDQLADGTVLPWREVLLTRPRRWFHFLWNPGRRAKKALFDAVGLMPESIEREDADVRMSVSYLLLLTYVTGITRSYPAAKTQFLVMTSRPSESAAAAVSFLSEVHRL